jgi:hypothetical protein
MQPATVHSNPYFNRKNYLKRRRTREFNSQEQKPMCWLIVKNIIV